MSSWLHHWPSNGPLGTSGWRQWETKKQKERVRVREKRGEGRDSQRHGWGASIVCLWIKGECNEQDNEPGTSQHNMQTGDERSGFQSKPLGVSWLRKGEKGRRGRAERRPKEGGGGGGSVHPRIPLPSSSSHLRSLTSSPPVLNAPLLSGCCFDSWPVSIYC